MRFFCHHKHQFLRVCNRIDSKNQEFEALSRHEQFLLELSSKLTPLYLLNSMIIRAGILVVALVSAIKVCQFNIYRSRRPSSSRDENEKATSQQEWIEKKNGQSEESHVEAREKEEPQVNNCKCKSVELAARRPEFSVQDMKGQNVSEIDLLNNAVKKKENKSWNLEVKLIELYFLEEQQSRIALLQKQLTDKTSEISMLSGTIHKLKDEMEKLYEEVKLNQLAEKQLESAKLTISELQKKRELCAEQMEAQLLMLKEQVLGLCAQGEYKGHIKVDKKLKALKDVELKAFELRRLNIELLLEKRELVFKLSAANAKIAELSCMTEQKTVAKFQEEISRLKHANNNLLQEIEKLKKDRFSYLEELIYQRWLNKCLRFELEDYRSPGPKKIKPILSSKLNFRSDSNSSGMSSVDSDEFTNTTTTSSSSSNDDKKKSSGLIPSIKRWGRSKENSSLKASESRIPQCEPGCVRRFSTSSIPSSTLGLRIRADSDSGMLFSSKNREAPHSNSPGRPTNRRTRRVSFNDSFNSIRYIYDDRTHSDQETSDNSQKFSESSSDCSGSTILERKKDELPSSTAKADKLEGKKIAMPSSMINVQGHEDTRELNNQDLGTETQVFSRRQTSQAEILSSGMPDGAPGTSKFCDQVVNLTVGLFMLVLFLALIYFRVVSAFKHLLLLI